MNALHGSGPFLTIPVYPSHCVLSMVIVGFLLLPPLWEYPHICKTGFRIDLVLRIIHKLAVVIYLQTKIIRVRFNKLKVIARLDRSYSGSRGYTL